MGRDPLRPRKKNKVLENPRSGKSETGIHFFREIERFKFKKRESASILALCWPSRLYQLAHSLNLTKSPNETERIKRTKRPTTKTTTTNNTMTMMTINALVVDSKAHLLFGSLRPVSAQPNNQTPATRTDNKEDRRSYY